MEGCHINTSADITTAILIGSSEKDIYLRFGQNSQNISIFSLVSYNWFQISDPQI